VSVGNVRGTHPKKGWPQDIPYYSAYWILVNTNYSPRNNDDAEEMGEILANACQNVFWTYDGLAKVIRERHDRVPGGTFTADELEDFIITSPLQLEGNVEKGHGKHGRRIHAHFTLTFRHFRQLQIDKIAAMEAIVEEIDDPRVSNVFVAIKGRQLAEADAIYTLKDGRPKPKQRLPDVIEGSQSIADLLRHDEEEGPGAPTTAKSLSIGGSSASQ
jgi:hypothetical protein